MDVGWEAIINWGTEDRSDDHVTLPLVAIARERINFQRVRTGMPVAMQVAPPEIVGEE